MKEKEPEEPTKTEPSAIPSRRDFLAALGAVTGLAASGAAALVTAEDAEAAAIAYPEASPSFAGAPSASFLSSGQPLTGPGLSQSYSYPAGAAAPQESWPAGVPSLTAPNFLVIMVDELWNSLWLPNDANNNPSTATIDANCPNLASLRDNSIRFLSYYAAACNCTPSRGTINTGLYARQTNLYSTQVAAVSPNLQLVTNAQGSQTGFSTFGSALQDSIFGVGYNSPSPYLGNVYHVGKWHLSNFTGNMPASALNNYGFQYVRSMKVTQSGPSPNGIINEGQQPSNHGNPVGGAAYYSSDPDVTNYALSTLGSIASGSAPWCLVVSYINPHDMADYPAYFSSPANGYNMWPPNFTPATPRFAPNGGYNSGPTALSPVPYSTPPANWNYEASLSSKPSLQAAFQTKINSADLSVGSWTDFLNNYIWLQKLVDTQIGNLLSAPGGLRSLPLSVQQNTIVIFTTDHGDYAGSHGLHAKGGGAYEEAINIPLYVQLPQQTNPVQYYQATSNFMCSAVDFFGMIIEFATGNGAWKARPRYTDLANRQSIVYKIYHPATTETRTFPVNNGGTIVKVPYVLYTTDEVIAGDNNLNDPYGTQAGSQLQNHVSCLRTKTAKSLSATKQIIQSALQYSGMFAAYDFWPFCSTSPSQSGPLTQYEFYDFLNNYGSTGSPNFGELGNQAPVVSGGPGAPSYCPVTGGTPTQQLFCTLVNAAYSGPGVFSSELAAPLAGVATDGSTSLSSVATTALTLVAPAGTPTGYYDYLNQIYSQPACPA